MSGSGKTSVATELQRRGYHVIHGDRELAYRGDPRTGEPLDIDPSDPPNMDVAFGHRHHLWDVDKVRALTADRSWPVTFFCGGSRNFDRFVGWFDAVFVLAVDHETLKWRLASRPDDEFGGTPAQRDFILGLSATRENIPSGAIEIDGTAPLARVVDAILAKC
ncbi:hypothetical protein SAMN02745157_4287 [Kaistia soli DSM 19436]|uniref:Broad-specificity NMP kinase n=1 Tax=Kaistia soli DSM 19436 TaxID=1122133 RepID=A0A1M5K4J0_9HYPH|nr:hypothetical protein SAMN02745157_4287 [Kaistia soli DSM 19436]